MNHPDNPDNLVLDFSISADNEIPVLNHETQDIPVITPENHPWFFDDELTPIEKQIAELWAEQLNLYYYTL